MKVEYLTVDDVSKLTGFSKSTLYKLTAKRAISFFKPFGKRIFFSMEQVEQFFKKNLILSEEALEREALKTLAL